MSLGVFWAASWTTLTVSPSRSASSTSSSNRPSGAHRDVRSSRSGSDVVAYDHDEAIVSNADTKYNFSLQFAGGRFRTQASSVAYANYSLASANFL